MTDHRPALQVEDLHVYFGAAHILQGVSLELDSGITAVVGRNGMGKTTLCNAIMGLVPASSGTIRLFGADSTGRSPDDIVGFGVGYIPQGRRIWPSLSVDEHLRVTRTRRSGPFTVERVYEMFPRLAERRNNGGAQLSGGEQQMLAIGRALLTQPRLLIMDEPTEGLAPIVVDQVTDTLKSLGREGNISVLLIEQNIGVATDVASTINVMMSGKIVDRYTADELIRDPDLQKRLLGVAQSQLDESDGPHAPNADDGANETALFPTRWSTAENLKPLPPKAAPTRWSTSQPEPESDAETDVPAEAALRQDNAPLKLPIADTVSRAAFIAGTFDTKGKELLYIKSLLDRQGLRTVTVDLSTTGLPVSTTISARQVASYHPDGVSAVFTGDRGKSVSAMTKAFERFIMTRQDIGGIISAGGSGGTALVSPAMRALPIGVPKFIVSTVASGNVAPYVGPSDICMMYSVTDVQGINSISERVLANAAHALAGMIGFSTDRSVATKSAIGLTMFGVTTPCVQQVQNALSSEFDCLVFHATGVGGRSMEKLIDSGMITAALDITTTEVADMVAGGVFAADEDRFGSIIRSKIPYVASCGALDMANFGALDSVPDKFRDRNLYVHNPQVTLMRTSPAECAEIGRFIAGKLNRMDGPVRFLIPLGGVSMIDAEGKPFHDPAADRALFEAIESNFQPAANRKLIKCNQNINDPAFADALVSNFRDVMRG